MMLSFAGAIGRAIKICAGLGLMAVLAIGAQTVQAADGQPQGGTQMLEEFGKQQAQRVNETGVSEHKKQVIMFLMGLPLVILLLITGGLGVAIGVYGKPWFITHMIFAGLTITLALVHVVVALVWFYPF